MVNQHKQLAGATAVSDSVESHVGGIWRSPTNDGQSLISLTTDEQLAQVTTSNESTVSVTVQTTKDDYEDCRRTQPINRSQSPLTFKADFDERMDDGSALTRQKISRKQSGWATELTTTPPRCTLHATESAPTISAPTSVSADEFLPLPDITLVQ